MPNMWSMPVTARPWPEILDNFEQIGTDWIRPMCELVRQIQDSRYAPGLHAVTSMHTLVISNTDPFHWGFENLRIDWDPFTGQFCFALVEEPFVRTHWHKKVPRDEAFAALERFVRRKRWFVEYGPALAD